MNISVTRDSGKCRASVGSKEFMDEVKEINGG